MFANNNFLILALVDVSNEFGSFRLFVRQSVRSQCKISELAHQFLFFLHEVGESQGRKSDGSRFLRKTDGPKTDVDRDLIHSCLIFYWRLKVLMVFLLSAKPTGLQKNKILELFQKPLGQTEAGFFKLGYLRNELRYEVKFLYVTRQHPLKEQVKLVTWIGCGQTRLGMPKVMANSKSA